MAISIREALRLPVMSETELIAGVDGLDNVIKWVTIVEVLEDINRLQEGEFLITTGFGLMESETQRRSFQQLLSMNKLSGVAIYTGFYIQEIPDTFIEIANKSNLPLIQIPAKLNFSMITKAILEQIANKQMRLLQYSLNIHQQLTNHVLRNRGLDAITNTLANLIKGSIVIYTDLGQVALHCIRHERISLGENSQVLMIDGQEFPVSLQPGLQSVRNDETASNFNILTCPIIADDTIFGYIVAMKEAPRWEEMDSTAIEHAATVYAIEYLKQQAVHEAQIRLQGDFLEDIMHTNMENRRSIIQRGKNFGLDLTKGQAVLNVKIDCVDKEEKTTVKRLYRVVHHVLEHNGSHFIVRNRRKGLLVLTEINNKPSNSAIRATKQLGTDILNYWNRFFSQHPIRVGIGRMYDSIDLLSESVKEADYAVSFSQLLPNPTSVTHYDDLGMFHLLFEMKEKGVNLQRLYEEPLNDLLGDRKRGEELLLTLEMFLYNNQNIQSTANDLFIHRHTLKYRLNQIEKKTGLNLNSTDDRMKLYLAILAFKLVQHLENMT